MQYVAYSEHSTGHVMCLVGASSLVADDAPPPQREDWMTKPMARSSLPLKGLDDDDEAERKDREAKVRWKMPREG